MTHPKEHPMSQNEDINQIIASAVNARVEAAVVEALASDGAIRAYVTAALNQPASDRYEDRGKTFLRRLLERTIEQQTQAVVVEEIKIAEDAIRKEIRAALKKSIGVITDSLVDGFVASASGRYPSIKVVFGD